LGSSSLDSSTADDFLGSTGFGSSFRTRRDEAGDDTRDMMIGTAILGVVMAIGRLLIPGELPSWIEVLRASGLERPQTVTVLSIFSVVSLVVKLPCVWIALAMTKEKVIAHGTVWIFTSGLIGLLEFGILCTVVGPPGGDGAAILFGMIVGHTLMAAVMIGVLYFLRLYGYGMTRIRKRSANTVTES